MASFEFKCIDGHTCGNPVRLVAEGGPDLEGGSMSAKRQYFMAEFDWIRKGLMFEPRGHDMMSGSILYPPSDPSNDIGILFIETSGCLPMCGHGAIGTVTMAIEEGLIKPHEFGKLKLEVPAGVVDIEYKQKGDKVSSVKITNVPSYLAQEEIIINCSGLGELSIDVAYGGNFYAIIDRQQNFAGIQEFSADQIIAWSREIRKKINDEYDFVHPLDETIKGLSHVLWDGEVMDPSSSARNAVFYGDKAIDRSPCGTGTSARMAQRFSKGLLEVGQTFIHESIIGSKFKGRVEKKVEVGDIDAILPSIEGWAIKTGYNNIIIDEEDPFAFGFQVI